MTTYTPEQLREWADYLYQHGFMRVGVDEPHTIIRKCADALERLAERDEENAVLRDAINDALPWMIKLGDYIGNGTQADPMGRCNAILKMRIAVEKRDD